MFLVLVAVVFAGLAGAGTAMILARLTGGRLPRWTAPAAAGAAMLTATIASEYAWYPRVSGALPPGVVVAHAVEARAPWRPWTYLRPHVERFVAIDAGAIRRNAEEPGLRMVDLYLYGRWAPVRAVQVAVDCAGGRRADPGEGADGPRAWRAVGPDDPILRAACAAPAG